MSHIDDTSQLTRKLLLYMDLGLANNEIQLIAEAAKYHDIGKIYIPDHILYKPGELTKEELENEKRQRKRGTAQKNNRKAVWHQVNSIAGYWR